MSTQGRHLDRLTAVDASFLANESSSSHMHVGAILIFEGPPPRYVDLVEHVRGRLHLVPRFRQKLVVPPLEAGRPLWADDVNFNLSYHIRHTALPEPGGEAQLKRLCRAGLLAAARSLEAALGAVAGAGAGARPLRPADQDPPRDGRRDQRRRHRHGAVRPRAGARRPPRSKSDWVPQKSPSTAELVGRGIGDAIGMPIALAGRAVEAVRHPETTARKAVEGLEALTAVFGQFADPAPDVPLNHEIGPHRRYVWARSELATFKRIKDSLGGTVNDVVLAVVTGSIREWLHSRGVRTEGLELRALVPVSIRAEDEHGNLGNRITADARAAAGLHRGPGAPAAGDQRGDGRAEGIQTGAGRGNDLPLQRLRAADAARPGLAPQLQHPPLQPPGHQRAGAADPPLRAWDGNWKRSSRSPSCRRTTASRWRS